mgnify:CR=1 FL=1
MKLKVVESSWSGWSKDYKPEEMEKEYDIELNEKYVIKTRKFSCKKDNEWVEEEREIFSFNIIEINDSSIRIQTYQPFSDNDDDTVNLHSDKKEFIITNEKELKLITPTMDAGDIFILSLIN